MNASLPLIGLVRHGDTAWTLTEKHTGRSLLLATASVSVLGYDHDLTEPVVHSWNIRPTNRPPTST